MKLAVAGLTDDEIAILDGHWTESPPAAQVVLQLARRLTVAPHEVTAADVDTLRPHYNDAQITELVYAVARFNSVNRWTDALGLPQDRQFAGKPLQLNTPTSPEYADRVSRVIPSRMLSRPPLESREAVEAALAECRQREPLVKLPGEDEGRQLLPTKHTGTSVPSWVRALAVFPETGAVQVAAIKAIEEQGELSPVVRAKIAWVVARENRAWYALGQAQRRLHALGLDDDAIFALDELDVERPEAERVVHAFARKLTVFPHSMTDEDIKGLQEHFNDIEVAQIVYVIATANMFDRFTEALQLPLSDDMSIVTSGS